MKIEEYPCVKIKRQAQERIYEETKEMTPEQRLTYHQRSFAHLQARQAELRARFHLPAQAA
jgi:hypothetical protein